MNFLPNCRTKKLEMMYSISGSFYSFFNLEEAFIWPQIKPRKFPEMTPGCRQFGLPVLDWQDLCRRPKILPHTKLWAS